MEEPRAARTRDPARVRNYLGDESAAFHGNASEVIFPADEVELADALRWANESRTQVTVSGGGTSITGARVPMLGGIVISTERMVQPAEPKPPDGFERLDAAGFTIFLDCTGRRAIVPPAITLSALDAMLARRGLLYPPDPTEMSATIGGTVATNASGARSFHYGPTRAWVRRLRIVLPTGDVAEVRRGDTPARDGALQFRAGSRIVSVPIPPASDYQMPRTKNAAGLFLAPDLEPLDLFIGCEGLLGVVSEVEVALVPRPAQTLTLVIYFASRDAALDFIDSATSPARPFDFLSVEYFDGRSLEFMRAKYPNIPAGATGAVLCELAYDAVPHHAPYPEPGLLARLDEHVRRHSATDDWAVPGPRREEVRLFRHALPEAVNDYVRRRVGKIGTDMAVPRDRFREMVGAYERESESCGVRFLMFGHAGDSHLHLNYLPDTAEEAARAKAAYARLASLAVRLGGTISAEHGVGKKTIAGPSGRSLPYLQLLYGERGLRAIAAVKKAIDPNCILNVGNMVPPEMLR